MKRYAYLSKWISLAALVVLAIACFLPWAFYPDLGKDFTGFFTLNNAYGKPGKMLLILGSVVTACAFIPRIWPKRLAMFASAFLIAYGVTAVYRYVRCYGGTCPEVKIGLVLMILSTLVIFLCALFPEGVVRVEKKDQPAPQP